MINNLFEISHGSDQPFNFLSYLTKYLLRFFQAVLTEVAYNNINGGVHELGHNVKIGSAILAEIIATTVLVLTVHLTAVDTKTKTSFAPIPIGFAVAIGIYAM